MRKGLAFLLAALMIAPNLLWGQAIQKPVAAVGRVATVGDVTRSQKLIISNRLETNLSRFYELISQGQYKIAEEKAFEALDLEQCTQQECVRKIQELLQVDRLFILQIIREPEITQLTLNLMIGDGQRTEDGICKDCTTTKLYEKIDQLVQRLVKQDYEENARDFSARPPAEAGPAEKPGWALWTGAGMAAAGLVLGFFAQGNASEAQDLAATANANDDLGGFTAAESQMESAKTQADFANIVFFLSAIQLIYYLRADGGTESLAREGNAAPGLALVPGTESNGGGIRVAWQFRW